VAVSPRLVRDDDENRLVGPPGLPANINPYQNYGDTTPAVGSVLAAPGTYDFVFDTPPNRRPGTFTFRVWVNDIAPPSVHLVSRTVRHGTPILIAATDTGSGVDGTSIVAKLDGTTVPATFNGHVIAIHRAVAVGTHTVALTVSDYQETKNMEDVGPVLPNTRRFKATVVVR
jgi:hypothetical protein